jgi:hypothetical protein
MNSMNTQILVALIIFITYQEPTTTIAIGGQTITAIWITY